MSCLGVLILFICNLIGFSTGWLVGRRLVLGRWL